MVADAGSRRLHFAAAMVVIFADTVEEVRRLKSQIDARLRRIGRQGDMVPWVPGPEIREQLGLRALPAVVLIRNWPRDFEVMCEGREPPDEVVERLAEFFPREFDQRAFAKKTARTLQEARRNAPRTLQEAVRRLLNELSDDDKRMVRETPERELIQFHFGWGLGIRNAWLHGTDGQLLRSCGAREPDEASMTIIRAVWSALRSERRDR